MSSLTTKTKINLVTLLDANEAPLSFDQVLINLTGLLMHAPLQPLAQTLAEISSILYEEPSEEAERNLRAKFCSDHAIACVCPEDSAEVVHFLFHPNALFILNSLLTFNIELESDSFGVRIFHKGNEGARPVNGQSQQNAELPILEIFLLTNQLIIHLEENLENIPLYYSKRRVQDDIHTAIGKAKKLYDNTYFNKHLKQSLGYTVPQLSTYQLLLWAAIKMHKPAKIEFDFSFNKVKSELDKSNLSNLVSLTSIGARSLNLTLKEAAQALRDDFVLDNLCRGKPFLKINEHYICIRHDLLVASMNNFPYHHLLSILPDIEKSVLFREFGSTFEKQYIPAIAHSFIGKLIDPYKFTRKPYRGGKPGDLCLAISDEVKFILEIKSGRTNDSIKIGTKQELIDKYIRPKNSKGKVKGILQAVNDAKKLRDESFSGEIFTGIVFYDLPLNDGLDKLIEQEIWTTPEYQEYLKNPSNHPSIWLDVQNYELILSAVQQGVCLYDLLKKVSRLSPSKIRRGIVEFIIETGKTPSTSNLYFDEIKLLKESYLPLLNSDDSVKSSHQLV